LVLATAPGTVIFTGVKGDYGKVVEIDHGHGIVTRFTGTGPIRPIYFTILITHTILAVVIVPLVIITLSRALREKFDRHRAIARWTFPLWLYVSVTGVIIYWLLYIAYNPIGAPA